nr:hypothetical protein [Fusobacterium gastrosuis]
METKKRKGYKTPEGQKKANELYLSKNPEAKKVKNINSMRSNAKRYIREFTTIKELEEFKTLIKNREEKMTNLKKLYADWREVSEEMLADGYKGSVDCGEERVREDFSNYAGLETVISFEQMFELEKEYNK